MIRQVTLLSFAFGAISAFAGGFEINLTLSPRQTMPGVPVVAAIMVKNTSGSSLPFSPSFEFRIETLSGTTATFKQPLQKGIWQSAAVVRDKYVLADGEEVTFFVPFDGDFDSLLFGHGQLNQPGEYDLTVQTKGFHGVSAMSAPVHLSVKFPAGDDLPMWKDLMSGRDELLSVDTLDLCATIDRYRDAEYTRTLKAFCVARTLRGADTSREEYARQILAAANGLSPTYRDVIRFEIGKRYWADAQHAAFGLNQQGAAARIAQEGRSYAQDLVDNPGSDFGAAAGVWLKNELVTESEWRARYIKTHAPRPERNMVP